MKAVWKQRTSYKIVVGDSFAEDAESFHTLRYDSKPQSIDETKPGTLQVADGSKVTVTLPQKSGDTTAVFEGTRKPAKKECVLIFDEARGVFVLERLSSTMQVARVRTQDLVGSGNSAATPSRASNKRPRLTPAVATKRTGASKAAAGESASAPAASALSVTPGLATNTPEERENAPHTIPVPASAHTPAPAPTATKHTEGGAEGKDAQPSAAPASNEGVSQTTGGSGAADTWARLIADTEVPASSNLAHDFDVSEDEDE